MTPTDHPNDEEKRRTTVNRRTVLSMLGAGAVGSAAIWRGFDTVSIGSAQETGTEFERCDPCADPYSGYLVPGAGPMGMETDADAVNETQPDVGNETGNETGLNETGTNETGLNDTGNETGNATAGAQTGPAEQLDPVMTVELRVDDADVVFQEGDAEDTPPENGDPGAGNETGNETGLNETGNETGPDAENETGAATGDNETAGGATGNETAGGEGDEGEGGGPVGPQGPFPDFYFDPVGVRLRPGDVVAFDVISELHTVTAYHPRYLGAQQRVPDGAPGFTSPPIVDGDTWYYRFEESGVYDIQCLPHERLGMVMRAVVLEEGAEVPEGYGTGAETGNVTEGEVGNETGDEVGNETGADAGNETGADVGNETGEEVGNETEDEVGNETGDQGDEGGAGPEPGGRPPSEIAMKVLSASELTPENIVDQETVAWEDLTGVESQPPF